MTDKNSITVRDRRQNQVGAIVPTSTADIMRIAAWLVKAGALPESYYPRSGNEQERGAAAQAKAGIAIMKGLELGWLPMQSIQSMYVINGIPTLYGDGPIAIIRQSGQLEEFKETIEGEGDDLTALCRVKRSGEAALERSFSISDAARAGLLNKGTWAKYTKRMLQMRARAFALRDGFADILMGLKIFEEVSTYADASADEPPPAVEDPFADAIISEPPPATTDAENREADDAPEDSLIDVDQEAPSAAAVKALEQEGKQGSDSEDGAADAATSDQEESGAVTEPGPIEHADSCLPELFESLAGADTSAAAAETFAIWEQMVEASRKNFDDFSAEDMAAMKKAGKRMVATRKAEITRKLNKKKINRIQQ